VIAGNALQPIRLAPHPSAAPGEFEVLDNAAGLDARVARKS